ncbi:DUF485 domain-containing protein [Nocardiopsis dassonvillei]|jgi:uncharacterized membrane protein (DUF485 family)|uniref:DUF485 domain-containing protein n=1 Tax=Nocardiopsis dassonvillei TaxID=2014 RepID=UPI001E47DDA5|nr:DUF485 domain-containing protein [Nocardiopsis dassonvillei]
MATQPPPEPPPASSAGRAAPSEEAVIAMHSDPRFLHLKKSLYRFIFPMSVAFMVWYLLYVLMSAFARDIMSTQLFGNVNVALVFGVLQFVTTFGIAILYSSYSRKRLDTAAAEVREALETGSGGAKK